MTKYIIRRMIQAIPVLIGITIVVYVILQLAPGGPQAKFANNPRMTNEQKQAFMKSWGLDQPIPIQYCRWMGICDANGEGFDFLGPTGWPNFLPNAISGATNGILHGDLGYSITSGEKVNDTIVRAALPTFILATAALIIWIGIAIVIGVYSAIKRYSLFDNVSTVFAYVGFAIPTFWLGIMLVYIFGTSRILPVSGMVDIRVSPAFGNDAYWVYFGQHPVNAILDVGKHLILPVVTLVVVNIAGDSRFVRASMLDALNQDYVRTAKAKGLPGRTVTFKHALRNALLPVVTVVSLEFAFLIGGLVVTEQVFNLNGIGKLLVDAVAHRDYPLIQALVLLLAAVFVIVNFVVDMIYVVLDPRIRYS